MAENTYKKPNKKKEKESSVSRLPKINLGFLKDRRFLLASGFTLLVFSLCLVIAFISFLFNGTEDQSVVEALLSTNVQEAGLESRNWLGLFGSVLSYWFIFKWFGIASFLFIPLVFLIGFKLVFQKDLFNFRRVFIFCAFFIFWISITSGYFVFAIDNQSVLGFLSGGIGFELANITNAMIGWGTPLVMLLALVIFSIFYFNITSILGAKEVLAENVADAKNHLKEIASDDQEKGEEEEEISDEDWLVKVVDEHEETAEEALEEEEEEVSAEENGYENEEYEEEEVGEEEGTEEEYEYEENSEEEEVHEYIPSNEEGGIGLMVAKAPEEEVVEEGIAENYDPTLDLSSYKYPTLDLLNEYEGVRFQVSKEELEANKDKIVETLSHYNIGISNIKATIGPTVTLYEIVPDAGIRISKIKNLEDDIALSLAALGIRIIAPIPGKGTIGIEVPNSNKETVSIRSVLSTEKFLKSDKDLPVVFGKTISNEVFVGDLAKMPHLLMAGATGQGKSVGLNVLLASLIYKKHPSQLKFVLVDPKKVELSLFNKIERHFLAKLPDTQDAIITDTKKVIHTLNSLCMEMDMRYDLLKDANCRNLKEYNKKFVERRLNPNKGHRFMPYIVLVIDELADLMMTAGKEVETPIARLAQLARAIGIHLVVATQRPSVNVITGIIKANFPARLSFKVTSKIDSRTILDAGGAEQLIGQGDMLFSMGSELIRVQCAFIDTPEVEKVCEFIGSQRGYDSAYMLPEYVDEEGEGSDKGEFNFAERDSLFEEAARIIVTHQQGSTSLLQRRLKLGYNRAGRLIDQLESAGVVGPFEGSKAREVLVTDEYSLEQLLNELDKKK